MGQKVESVVIPCPYGTIAMVTFVGPFCANAWVQFSVPEFTGTPELALGPRPPDTTLTRWLYDELRRAMLTGRLKRGTRLPATRDFAGQHGISRRVVVNVFEQLRTEGYHEQCSAIRTFITSSAACGIVTDRFPGGRGIHTHVTWHNCRPLASSGPSNPGGGNGAF
jgi:hypothetical protein